MSMRADGVGRRERESSRSRSPPLKYNPHKQNADAPAKEVERRSERTKSTKAASKPRERAIKGKCKATGARRVR